MVKNLRLERKRLEEKQTRDWYANATFTLFPKLPPELKSNIWELAVAPELRRPRIHTITMRRAKFLSNQPTSPFLQICRGSRAVYLRSQKTAFQTYFNPELDIIYLRVLDRKLGDISDENPGETHFLRFFQSEGIEHVRMLALRNSLFFKLALDGDAASKHIYMERAMPNLLERIVVLSDPMEGPMSSFGTRALSFRNFSVRDQRQYARRAVCGIAMNKNSEMLAHCGIEPKEYRWVCVDDSRPDGDPVEEER